MSLEFSKYNATGNDFVVVDRGHLAEADPAELARKLCPRRLAVGADGLMVVGPTDRGIDVRYRNADGSRAAFCGNGARCAVHFAWSRGWVSEHCRLRFEDLPVEGEVLDGGHQVRITFRGVSVGAPAESLDGGRDGVLGGRRIEAGVPHLVLEVDAVEAVELAELFERVTTGPAAFDGNLTVVQVLGEDRLKVRTWERGCGETLACGSAALAAAAWAIEARGGTESWTVLPPSGLALTAERRAEGRMALTGAVREVFRGRLQI